MKSIIRVLHAVSFGFLAVVGLAGCSKKPYVPPPVPPTVSESSDNLVGRLEQIRRQVIKESTNELKDSLLTSSALEDFVDTESGAYDALRKQVDRASRTAHYLRRYVVTPTHVQLLMLEAHERLIAEQLAAVAKSVNVTDTAESMNAVKRQILELEIGGAMNAKLTDFEAGAKQFMESLSDKVPACVCWEANVGFSKDLVASRVIEHGVWFYNDGIRDLLKTKLSDALTPSAPVAASASSSRGQAHDELLLELSRLRAKHLMRARVLKRFRTLISERITYDRIGEWTGCFYGPIDQVSVIWTQLNEGGPAVAAAANEKFDKYVLSEQDCARFLDQLSGDLNEIMRGEILSFLASAESEYAAVLSERLRKALEVELHGHDPTRDPILMAMNIIDLVDLALTSGTAGAAMYTWMFGAGAAAETAGATLVAAVIVQLGISTYDAIREVQVIDQTRTEVLNLQLRALYGDGGLVSQIDAKIRDRYEVLGKEMRAGS